MKNLYKRGILKLMSLGFFNWLSDEAYLKWKFKLQLNYNLHLEQPKTFNEKLNWLKINIFKPDYQKYNKYVDKYLVRDYIAKTLGEQYLVPLFGVYENIESIPWETLPEKFVLKCTTGSGGNVICTDKTKLNIKTEEKKLKSFIKQDYFWNFREYQYKGIKPRFICEQFISETGITPDDYKVYCFNGKARLLEFHINRFSKEHHTCDYYDEKLNKLDFTWGTVPSHNLVPPHPEQAKKIIELSEIIARDFLHVRVDWYVVNGNISFGEITFINGGGFEKFDSYDDDLMLGSWLRLPID